MSTATGSLPPPTFTPGFMVLHGNRLEDLRDLLVQFVRSQPLPPLVPEVMLVQSNGMKHWLELALADDAALGICAATRLELPSRFLWQAYRQVLGADAVPAHLPFDKDHLVWRLVRLLPELAQSNTLYAPLQGYLQNNPDGRKLYQLAMQIADVLDGYQSYRADWLADWSVGTPAHDLLRAPADASSALPAEHAWQAQLWRDLRADVGPQLAEASRASVHARFVSALQAQLQAGHRPDGLPPRLIVFGISSLPLQTVEALAQLGRCCQVLLLVQNPCQYYWGDLIEGQELLRAQVRHRQSNKNPGQMSPTAAALHCNSQPLLASWGKQGRDYLHLLDEFDQLEQYQPHLTLTGVRVNVFVDPAEAANSPRLAQLQSSIYNLQPLPSKPVTLQIDDSISLVSCHSVQREVEVLHDRLRAWMDADPTLMPRDVMVMVPDMARFAPHIEAVFGRFAAAHKRHIAYSVADTTPRHCPLVQALEQLLSLPQSRLSLLDWLSLFEVAPVRQRFAVSTADVTQLHDWLNQAGVRWGLDATHRKAWGLPDDLQGLDQNTWAFGLRRLLLGYAVGAGATWANILPQAALGGLDAPLISALLNWLEATSQTLQALSTDQPPAQWVQVLTAMVQRFFCAGNDAEERLIQCCLAPLQAWLRVTTEARLDTPLSLAVVREHWLSQIEEPGLQQRFFGGGVQFGTLMPMRSIPFKVICLLGMNDADYPRQHAARDFDLMAMRWRAGDRSRREDDRYLFLEALLSARQKLYISWQGHSANDNSEQPPSVLVAQLMDYLQASWSPAIKPEQQPLQAFSASYFLPGSALQTYAADWAQVHLAELPPQPPACPAAAPPPSRLSLADLRLLLRQPVEVFFKTRLQIRLDSPTELEQQQEPFSLNALQQHQTGQALLEAPDMDQALQRLSLSGALPMAAFGSRLAGQLQTKVQQVQAHQRPWLTRYPLPLPAQSIELKLADVTLTGTLDGLWRSAADQADAPAPPGWLQLQQRVGAVQQGDKEARCARGHIVVGLWVNHLAACASAMPLTSVQLGLDGQVVFAPIAAAQALALLQELVLVYQAAWQRPLPVACQSAWAFLQAQQQAQRQAITPSDKLPPDPHEAAQTVFEGTHRPGERANSAYLSRAFDNYDELEAELPSWAQKLYASMAQHAQVSSTEPT